MTATIIIVTLNRPDCLRRCMEAIQAQERMPDQVIVVDSSRDDRSRRVMEDFPHAFYLSVPHLFGRMTAARNAGLLHATSEIVAFLDDDAYAHPAWVKNILSAYSDPCIGAVGGRALNNQPGEAVRGLDEIGRLKPNGFLTGNFGADPGRVIEVDHIIGCNMSFRRELLARLGGFREDFPGISGLCEDTDICLRAKALGCRIVFQPAARVDHVGAPQAVGRRFNARYHFYHRRNSFHMLIRNFGFGAMIVRFPFAIGLQAGRDFARNTLGACQRLAASFAGLGVGAAIGVWTLLRHGRDPVRHDAAGQAIRSLLMPMPEEAPIAPGRGN